MGALTHIRAQSSGRIGNLFATVVTKRCTLNWAKRIEEPVTRGLKIARLKAAGPSIERAKGQGHAKGSVKPLVQQAQRGPPLFKVHDPNGRR
jgi:hypothetical protein